MKSPLPENGRTPLELLSVVIPARSEESCIAATVEHLDLELRLHGINHEIIVVDDGSTDETWQVLCELKDHLHSLRPVQNCGRHGFGRAVTFGLEHVQGDAVVVMMADESDDCRDVVRYWEILNEGWDAVFGSRFTKGGGVVDYPPVKLYLNRIANWFLKFLFRVPLNDFTNAFKAYRRSALEGCHPFLSPHFNLTIELPLKVIVRGYSWTMTPITWRNRRSGESKLKIQEMGSRYLFIALYCWLEKYFSCGDYRQVALSHQSDVGTQARTVAELAQPGRERRPGEGEAEIDVGAAVEVPTRTERVPVTVRPKRRAAAIFVWAVWAVMLAATLGYAGLFTLNIPWADEWSHANVIAGEGSISISWLWEQHNEHRILIPKLLWLASLRLSGNNFRLLAILDVLSLGLLAFAAILSARRLRGRMVYADALLPLLILTPGQYGNLLWAWQVGFVLPTVLAGVLLLRIVKHAKSGVEETWRGAVAIVTCLVLLPFCSAIGLVLGAGMSVWADYLAFRYWRSNEASQRRKARLFLAESLFCMAMPFFYFRGLIRPSQIPPSPGLRASLITSLEFLGGSFGMNAGTAGWPYLGSVVLLLIGISVGVCVVAWRRREFDRSCTAGVLMLLLCTMGLALAIGYGRSGFGKGAGLQPRYVTLMIPGLCALYFSWEIFASRLLRRTLQGSLLVILCLAEPTTTREALAWGRTRMEQMQAFERDLRAGSPPWRLAEQHHLFLDQPEDVIADLIPVLHRGGIGLFRYVNGDRLVSLASLPVTQDSFLGFKLVRPIFVSAIRLKYAYTPNSSGVVEIMFRRSAQNGLSPFERHTHPEPGPDPANRIFTVVVNDVIDEFRIDRSKTVLTDIGLLLPDTFAAGRSYRFSGHLDLADQGRIAGWAWDRQHRNSPVQVKVYDMDTPIATVPAAQFRKDLRDAQIGNGDHSFSYPVAMQDAKLHIVHVLVAETNSELPGSPKAILESPSADAVAQVSRPDQIEGTLDAADPHQIAGWVWDKSRPDVPLQVDIRDGDTLLTTLRAAMFRRDLLDAHKGNGAHAFQYEPRWEPGNHATHNIRVFVSGMNRELAESPKTIAAK